MAGRAITKGQFNHPVDAAGGLERSPRRRSRRGIRFAPRARTAPWSIRTAADALQHPCGGYQHKPMCLLKEALRSGNVGRNNINSQQGPLQAWLPPARQPTCELACRQMLKARG